MLGNGTSMRTQDGVRKLEGCYSRSVPRPAAVGPMSPSGFEDGTIVISFHPTHVLWEKDQVKQLVREVSECPLVRRSW